ncbi:MAG: hypothetical protein GTO60_15935, partial [Gammaproteobacteria bacterium]|nr:hypothetical protein [Gammaproteobacteria bacterium]NIO61383.1 hypothetical protein [Gammaproteobacteria bacterium]
MILYKRLTIKLILFLLSLAFGLIYHYGVYSAPSPYAETVIINAQVITADSDDPLQVTIADAVAIKGKHIMAVGSND